MGQHYSHLSAEERGAIMVGKARGESARQLGRLLGRSGYTATRRSGEGLKQLRWTLRESGAAASLFPLSPPGRGTG
ncbi:hypothetical protein CA260_16665 [Dyella jiangningensis]|uniref:Transposase IS30-like HTH domain-containing protein n=1 Tax=Dyella jiangningensis TaxID=1379159 RepID=A0A328P0F8_9GAMM|nr:hypothetical protein CA260_16665 [Dyella jiangningensis]